MTARVAGAPPAISILAVAGFGGLALLGCGRSANALDDAGLDKGLVSAPSTTAPGAPRKGMVWIPAGVLRAGSARTEVPRVAAVEMPETEVPMGGFYIDLLPWPNEVGAIPTSNVTREEAAKLCATKNKRLCTELEWERACKGPDTTRYEYGPDYDADVCATGAAPEAAARRPSGQNTACQSAFGVRELHGSVAEWTDSHWGRGANRELGVVRGGNDTPEEVASRCAYAHPLAPAQRSPVTGFRCCAGPRNGAEVDLEVKVGPVLERTPRAAAHPSPALSALGGAACGPPQAPAPCWSSREWTWRPEANVELRLAGGCMGRWPHAHCGLAVSRPMDDHDQPLAEVDTGQGFPDVVFVGGMDGRVRVVGQDVHGRFVREVMFRYGRIDVHEIR